MFFKYDKETRDFISRIEEHLATYERILLNKIENLDIDNREARELFFNDEQRNYILGQIITAQQTATSVTMEISDHE